MPTASILSTSVETDPIQQKVMALEQEAHDLQVTDDTTRKAADLVIGKLKQAAAEFEAEKEQVTRPLLTALEENRTPYLRAIYFLNALRKELEYRQGQYLAAKRQEEQERQRKAIEDASRKQAQLHAQAATARRAAEALRASGATTKVVDKLEAKADQIELKAATIMPEIVAVTAKTADLGDGTTLTVQEKPDWVLPGWDKTGKLYADDPTLATLDFNRFKRFFVLDLPRVNRAVQDGDKLAPPFAMTTKYGSTHRKG